MVDDLLATLQSANCTPANLSAAACETAPSRRSPRRRSANSCNAIPRTRNRFLRNVTAGKQLDLRFFQPERSGQEFDDRFRGLALFGRLRDQHLSATVLNAADFVPRAGWT